MTVKYFVAVKTKDQKEYIGYLHTGQCIVQLKDKIWIES